MKKNNDSNIVKSIGVGILVAALMVGSGAFGWFANEKGWIKGEEILEELPEEEGSTSGMQVGEGEGNGISLMSAKIALEDYEEYGISELAESAVSITATITPAEADDKTVDWSIKWKNASSSWATGKTVTDYVTITPTSDGALTANAECKQAFGEQIVITCTSRMNSKATAEVTVDYVKKLEGTTLTLSQNSGGAVLTLSDSTTETWTWQSASNSETDIDNWAKQTVEYTDTLSIGTIDNTVKSHSVKIKVSDALKTQLQSNFPSYSSIYSATYTYTDDFSQGALFFSEGKEYDGEQKGIFQFCAEAYDSGWDVLLSSEFNKLKTCMKAASTDFVITVVTELMEGGTIEKSYNVNVSDNTLLTMVESVSTNNSSIKF